MFGYRVHGVVKTKHPKAKHVWLWVAKVTFCAVECINLQTTRFKPVSMSSTRSYQTFRTSFGMNEVI